MAFSEVNHTKGTLLVDLTDSGTRVELIEAPVARQLAVLRGAIDDLLTGPEFTYAEEAWCQVTLTDARRPLAAMDRLRARFPHALELRFEPEGVVPIQRTYTSRLAQRSDLDVCCDFLSHVREGADVSSAERSLLDEAVGRSREARGRQDDEGRVGAA